MRENEFERQVQQKMNELLLQPHPEVWDEVERRIRKKKRRRLLIIWFLLGGLLLAGGSSLWIINNTKEEQTITEQIITPGSTKEKEKSKNDESKSISKEKKEVNTDENNFLPGIKTYVEKEEVKKQDYAYKNKNTVAVNKNPKRKPIKSNEEKTVVVTDPADEKDDPGKNNTLPDSLTKKADDQDLVTSSITDSSANEIVAVSKNPDKITADESLSDSTKKVSTENKKKEKPKSKWEFGLYGSVGPSRLTNGKISSFGEKSLAADYSPTGGGAQQGSTASYADSVPLKGISWQAGLYAKKQSGRKTFVSAGLNFSFYSTKQRVGVFVDSVRTFNNSGLQTSTAEGFYRGGGIDLYTNKYYFIQVPLSFHWQVNRGERLPPIEWESGLAVSFLTGSDALVYNRDDRLFYKDKRVYSNVNLVFQTAITVRMFEKNKHPMTAGFYYNYHISKLQKINSPDYNYLSSFGIKLNWIIKKNK